MKTINTPDYLQFVFVQNEKRPDIYDLQGKPENVVFTFFRLSTPRQSFLIKQGAKYVLESWKENIKVSFTGLISANIQNWYWGDIILKRPEKDPCKSFLMVEIKDKQVFIYIFPDFTIYPNLRLRFCAQFIAKAIKKKSKTIRARA